ncbi:helix-turn-helix domain-containing protein, partial [Balneolaceae bacterium ANBcel3]|nr:helix-turn-helix domain-containing protein [Balneolaceae bacterium ANBcel3]
GRQSLGAPDNLPVVFNQNSGEDAFNGPEQMNISYIYRALLDMKSDMSDMKQMLGTLFYNSLKSGHLPKSLPQSGYRPEPHETRSASNMVDLSAYSEADFDEEDPITEIEQPYRRQTNPRSETVNTESLNEDQKQVLSLFESEELPSVEEMERFLIEKALHKYAGNRRKTAQTLGMSERTLYRKIDQYEIE